MARALNPQVSVDDESWARTSRIINGGKRPRRNFQEISGEVFQLMSDGQKRSTSAISEALGLSWSTADSVMCNIDTIQHAPLLSIQKFRRKRFYQVSRRRG